MKKIVLMIISLIFIISLVGCSSQSEAGNEDTAGESSVIEEGEVEEDVDTADSAWPRTIVDAAGNEVYFEEKPESFIKPSTGDGHLTLTTPLARRRQDSADCRSGVARLGIECRHQEPTAERYPQDSSESGQFHERPPTSN